MMRGYECGPCGICPSDNRCDLDHDDKKFSVVRIKSDGKCEQKCEKEDKAQEKMDKDEGWYCGFCPPEIDSDDKDSNIVIDPDGKPPKCEKCTLKRAAHVMRYEPNWPAIEADVTVQIKVHRTNNIYSYNGFDTNHAEFHIDNEDEFFDMYDEELEKDEQGVSVRFVSPRGEGEWNSCAYSPIAIDLNRDGEITRIEREEGWEIDITGDGELEFLNEWFGPEDGILIDLSGQYELYAEQAAKHGRRVQEHLVISGVQLLGDQGGQYADGFAKLEKRDADGNGIVENTELYGLHLWIDANSNARLDEGELKSLAQYKIAGLRVTHNGMKSTAILTNGRELMTEDLWLKR